MKSCGNTDMGQKRTSNQDYMFCSDVEVGGLQNLYIVADGMGGHKAGDHASHMAVDRFVQLAEQTKDTNPVTMMRTILNWVNEEVYEEANSNIDYSGMGTTFVAATVIGNMAYVLNVGDSRLYLLHEGHIRQVTLDHSMVEEMVRSGELTEQEARRHPRRNVITRAVGVQADVLPDFFEVEFMPGDSILLCSDGLSNMIQDTELEKILCMDKSIDDKVKYLIDRANYYGGYDNIAAVVAVNE